MNERFKLIDATRLLPRSSIIPRDPIATRIFDATWPATPHPVRLTIECNAPPELLERIRIRLVALRD